jgi:hypothetical protein
MDCSSYLSRIQVKDLSHRMLNVTLLGKVVGLANNVSKCEGPGLNTHLLVKNRILL